MMLDADKFQWKLNHVV